MWEHMSRLIEEAILLQRYLKQDKGNGILSCAVKYDESGVKFNNEELVKVDGKKTWDDADNQDGIRPESIRIQLLADGKPVEGKALTVTEEKDWKWSFGILPKYEAAFWQEQ